MIGNAYVEGLGAFSKVTKLVRDVWQAPTETPARLPPPERPPLPNFEQNYDSLQSLENGFENLLPDIQPDLGPAPDVTHGKAIGMSEWMSFINSEGKVENVKELKKLVHNGVRTYTNAYYNLQGLQDADGLVHDQGSQLKTRNSLQQVCWHLVKKLSS